MTSMLDEYNAMSEEKHMEICRKADELQKKNLGENEEMRIAIVGCDDTTYISEEDWGMSFSAEELEILGKLADLSRKKSDYQCQPVIRIEGDK